MAIWRRASSATQPSRRRPAAGDAASRSAADERVAAIAAVHEAEEAHLALLGRLLDEDRREAVLGKTLRAALAGIADRLEHLLREEAQALAALKSEGRTGRAAARLDAASAKQVAELESDVLGSTTSSGGSGSKIWPAWARS